MKYINKTGKEIFLKKGARCPANVREIFTLPPLKTAPKFWFSLGARAHTGEHNN